ncbi:MAG: nucleotidyltransferase family protein, partial [Bacteroidales bacterium]|nr:nucleotidyltransferase family protein [Bacteroidales bacterium]
MDRTGEVFLKVLRNGLWKKEELPTNAGDFSWEGIFRLAKAQSLTGIIGQAVLQCPEAAASLPDGYREKIRTFIIKNCAVHNTFNRCLVHVVSCLRSAGVEPVLLKGQGLARNWPCPELRQCGDIDLWVGEKNYDKAMNVLLPLSSAESCDIEESIKHASLQFGMVTVEIHRFSGVDTSSRKLDAIYRKYSEDGLSNRTVPLDFGGTDIMTPSDNFNAFYIFRHLWHHFMAVCIGLRQMCDLALFLH